VTAAVIANQVFVACMLVDPTNNAYYRIGGGEIQSGEIPHVPNHVRVGCTLIDPVTGLPYH
jgi:hypothetical protein